MLLHRILQRRGSSSGEGSGDSNLHPLPGLDQSDFGDLILSVWHRVLDHPATLATGHRLLCGGSDCDDHWLRRHHGDGWGEGFYDSIRPSGHSFGGQSGQWCVRGWGQKLGLLAELGDELQMLRQTHGEYWRSPSQLGTRNCSPLPVLRLMQVFIEWKNLCRATGKVRAAGPGIVWSMPPFSSFFSSCCGSCFLFSSNLALAPTALPGLRVVSMRAAWTLGAMWSRWLMQSIWRSLRSQP